MTGSPSTIYNSTDGPLAIDRAGRMLAARERTTVDTLDGLSRHIKARRLIVIHDLPTEAASSDEPADEAEATPTPSKRTRKGSASTSPQEA